MKSTSLKACVINFPGSNCVFETVDALNFSGFKTEVVSYKTKNIEEFNLIVLPGGFSWGDYICAGRIAKFSNVIQTLKNKKQNQFVLGICNGFQILLESGFLKGALIENYNQKFICDDVEITFNNQTFTLPTANHTGRYYIDDFSKIKDYELIKYVKDINGSSFLIAGLYDKKNKIMGLMPHPERNLITPFKKTNGKIIFDFIKEVLKSGTI